MKKTKKAYKVFHSFLKRRIGKDKLPQFGPESVSEKVITGTARVG